MVDINLAMEMRERGVTLREIGEHFGVSRERIRQKIGNTRNIIKEIHKKKKDKIRVEAISLREKKLTLKQIADILKIDTWSLSNIMGPVGYLNPVPDGLKRCHGKCGKDLNPSEFYSSQSNRCKKCNSLCTLEYSKRNRDKRNARQATRYAIKTGKLVVGECILKDSTCQGKIEAHHHMGYSKENRLNVLWVCDHHHPKLDKLTPDHYTNG